MQTIEITYKKAPVKGQSITDRIKTFEDACEAISVKPGESVTLNSASPVFDQLLLSTGAYIQLAVIAAALNEGWTPDWDNDDEYKYYPYFNMENGFSFRDVLDWDSFSDVGSRLCFKTRELAEYAGRQFLQLYKELFEIPKTG